MPEPEVTEPGCGTVPGPDPSPEPLPEREPEPQPEPHPTPGDPEELHRQARELVESLPRLTPDLRGVPVAMRRELTGLALRWLEAGHTPRDIRAHLLRGMPSDGSPVQRPGGLVRYLLREVPAVWASPERVDGDRPAGTRAQAAVGLRECEGDHDTVTVFRPVGGETVCGRCLRAGAVGDGAPAGEDTGYRDGVPDGQSRQSTPVSPHPRF